MVATQSYTFLYPNLGYPVVSSNQGYPVVYPRIDQRLPPFVEPVVVDLAEEYQCEEDGLFADEENGCSSYYVCHGGKVRLSLSILKI